MPFENHILVAIDGSACSQTAIEYALWLGQSLHATVTAQHIIDPRMIDILVAPELAEALGFKTSVQATERVEAALRKIGALILELFSKQAEGKVHCQTFMDVGWIVDQILDRTTDHDLTIVGHSSKRGRESAPPISSMIGSVAERVACLSKKPVLVASEPLSEVQHILVAFDGSEPSRGALLLGKALAEKTGLPLCAATVVSGEQRLAEAHLTIEQGLRLIGQENRQDVFSVLHGPTTESLLEHAASKRAILLLGSYGFRLPEENVLGSTSTAVMRKAKCSVLIFR